MLQARTGLSKSYQKLLAFQCPSFRQFSNQTDLDFVQKHYQVHRRGDEGYGSREYLLLPPGRTLEEAKMDDSLKAAALLAHRNIVFGARAFQGYSMNEVCHPLVEVAVRDASENGEQPQAIASLDGLCDWIRSCLQDERSSNELQKLQSKDEAAFRAVSAIAMGSVDEGDPAISMGTYRDGEEGWKRLATEFLEEGLSEEAELYGGRGARLVGIEMAYGNPDYLTKAGGAMARYFFL